MATRRRSRPIERGARGYLRRPGLSDSEELIRLARSSRGSLRPWVSPAEDEVAFADYLRRSRRRDTECLLLCHIDEHAIIGVFNLSQIVHGGFKSAYLGYWVGAEWQGLGYMTEGLQLSLRHAFTTLRLHRIEANLQPDNVRSRRLVERGGFVREGYSPRYLHIGGRWRDHERWAILIEDWRGQRRAERQAAT